MLPCWPLKSCVNWVSLVEELMKEVKMPNGKHVVFVLAVLILIFGASCRRSDKAAPLAPPPLPGQAAGTRQAPEPGGVGEGAGAAPLARGVSPRSFSGRADFSTVTSESPCKAAADCSFTKFENVPKSKTDCTCQAACEPHVVNIKERDAREESNKRLCGVSDWFGPHCPAPPCNFLEYDHFECREGKCVGIDLDGD